MTPSGQFDAVVSGMLDKDHRPVTVAPGDGYRILLPLKDERDLSFGIILRML